MQKRLYFLFLTTTTWVLSLLVSNTLNAQSGCAGCVINLPQLPNDTIYISSAPDGVAGQYYDGDISFRLPKSTTPVNSVDPSTPPGLGISNITIVSVVNVPPGLSWQPNQFVFDPGSQTDGCVKFCGTPLQSGFYNVQVFVTAQVLLVTQSTSFTFPMYIAPAVSNNDGFSMQNSSGCGQVTVDFVNNVPANGNPGYSYLWDFGNGNTSTVENPGPQTFTNPGQYEVKYKAIIDTFGYKLTTVRVLSAGCNDIGIPTSVPPDLYIKIKDPNGNLIISTTPVDNVSFPFAANINLMLGSGTYELEVRDDDVIGSESCGYVYFNQNTTDTLKSGSLKVLVDIIHPVSTIISTDTVVVFETPAPPVVLQGPALAICTGTEAELEVGNYQDNLQWYQNGNPLFGETDWTLFTAAPGTFMAEYTSADGCKSQSDEVEVTLLPLPSPPAFHAEGNLLVLNDPSLLPAGYSLQWFQDGILVPGATEETFCVTAPGTSLYTLLVTDITTGCEREFSIGVSFNPGFNCGISSAGEMEALDASLVISPNPMNQIMTVGFDTAVGGFARFMLLDAAGRMVLEEKMQLNGGHFRHDFDLAHVGNGVYFLKIQIGEGVIVRKVVKQ